MKNTKMLKTLIIPAILFISVLFGWKMIGAAQNYTDISGSTIEDSREKLNTSSEFYFRIANGSKTWHIIDRYTSLNENDTLDCNNSVYLFTSDSVLVINDIITSTDEELALSQVINFTK